MQIVKYSLGLEQPTSESWAKLDVMILIVCLFVFIIYLPVFIIFFRLLATCQESSL